MLMDEGTCAPVMGDGGVTAPPVRGWEQEMIIGETEFQAVIGPSGGSVGYQAITGNQPWGISWYVNGYIIPKIYMRRGDTFTFRVSGGDDPTRSASYHPFYLTSSDVGGYATLGEADRAASNEVFYAGVDASGNPTAGKTRPSAFTTCKGSTCLQSELFCSGTSV